jgi:hypothetical protein
MPVLVAAELWSLNLVQLTLVPVAASPSHPEHHLPGHLDTLRLLLDKVQRQRVRCLFMQGWVWAHPQSEAMSASAQELEETSLEPCVSPVGLPQLALVAR